MPPKAGKLVVTATSARQAQTSSNAPSNSQNLVKVPNKKKKEKNKVASSFMQAFFKMAPSKEIRFIVNDLAMLTNGALVQHTNFKILDQIVQGTQINHRIGSNIHISYVHLNASVISKSSTKAKAMRFLVFREVNNGGVNELTFAFLFKTTGATTVSPTGLQGDITLPLNRELVQPIFDRRINVKPQEMGVQLINYKIKINKIVRYTPTDGADASPYHGRLIFLVLLADMDNLTTGTIVVYNSLLKVYFKDYRKAR